MSAKTRTHFSKSLPLGLVNNDKQMDYNALFDTHNVKGRIAHTVAKNEWSIKPGESDKAFAAKQAHCESVGNGDQFDHLKSLASTEDTASRVRCGWVYNNSNPDNGRGAFGLSEGPFKTNTPGQWMWNLKKAQEKYHTAICQKIQSCSDIDAEIHKKRCGWCTRSGKAVPVAGGQLAYPSGTNTSCPPRDVILQASQCPRPAPITDPNYVRTPAEACVPMPNGALGRACLLQKVTAAGCSDRGTLSQALRSGSDNNYTSVLAQEKAFKIYQQRAAIPMDSTALRTGKVTITDALNTFSRVQDLSASAANAGLQHAARDLCLNKGAIDEFDFCTELMDNTTGPFELDCLQKQFMRMGGQKAGASYPTPTNIGFYNNLGNWGAVKRYIQSILDKTKSQDRKTQEWGMKEFYGIVMQNKQKPLPYGPEIAYRLSDMTVLLACDRRLPIPDGYTLGGCTSDRDEMLDTAAARHGYTMGIPPPPPYKEIKNVDWAGNDIACIPNKTKEECRAMCDARSDCVAVNHANWSFNGCCLKTNLANRWDTNGNWDFYIKQPLQCKAPYSVPPQERAGWNYKGCYRDSPDRALPNYLGNVQYIEQCVEKAKQAGFNTAGIQYFGQCWAGNNRNWDKHGFAGCCEGMGGAWTNQIYVGKTPKDVPLSELQTMFEKAGCTRKLEEGHVGWWRDRSSLNDVQNDMNAYGSLTRGCSGNERQHDFCIPGKCK
jgi:hypothetical protein